MFSSAMINSFSWKRRQQIIRHLFNKLRLLVMQCILKDAKSLDEFGSTLTKGKSFFFRIKYTMFF